MEIRIIVGVVVAAGLLVFAILMGRLRMTARATNRANRANRSNGDGDGYLAAALIADPGSAFTADCSDSPSSCDGGGGADGGGGGGD